MKRSRLRPAILAMIALPGWGALVDTQANKQLWDEIGLRSAETVEVNGVKVDAYRFRDATGALAGSFLIPHATAAGNYALACDGPRCPAPAQLAPLAAKLPEVRQGALPVLLSYPPAKGMSRASERYILGPASLNEALPQVSPETAAFQYGTEAISARYRIGKSEPTLAIFSYPTPGIARKQFAQFAAINGAYAKRSGPFIGVVLNAPDGNAAQTLLKEAEYQASISWDETPPLVIRPQTAAQIVLGGMELAGILMIFCLVSGLLFGLVQYLRHRFGPEDADNTVIGLHLTGK